MIRNKWGMLVGALALAFVTACSGGGGGGAQPANEAAEETETAQGSETSETSETNQPQPVEITIWDAPLPDDPTKDITLEIQEEFAKKYPHITVHHETRPTGTNERQAFMTAMAGGNGPDAYDKAFFPTIRDWVKAGYAQDLSSYWASYEDKDQFIPSSMQQGTIDGKVYGVPKKMYVVGLMYNNKLFEEAGLPRNQAPKDWDQFVEYAAKLTDPSKNRYGYALLGMDWADWFFEYYVWQAGGDLTTLAEDGTITLDFTKEPTVTALQFWHDLKWKHKVVQNNVVQNFDDNRNDFYQGRAAMMLGASDWFGDFAKNGMDLNDVGFSPLPVGPSGKAPSQMGGEYWIINPKSSKEKQDAAWLYVTYMSSKEVNDKLNAFKYENGIMPNLLSVRSDVNPLENVQNVPPELIEGVQKAAEDTQLEYALKERLSPYIVKAIQNVLLTENPDIPAELKVAEETAQREVVDPYNAEIKQ